MIFTPLKYKALNNLSNDKGTLYINVLFNIINNKAYNLIISVIISVSLSLVKALTYK